MRWNRLLFSVCVAGLCGLPVSGLAASFGSVVPLVGHAADIALDESRGLLYIANFTANRIDVMSTSDNTIRTSMSVSAQPGGLALSPDGRFLVVTNYAGWGTAAPPASANLVTIIDLTSQSRRTYSTGDPPLAAAFVNTTTPASGLALVATTSGFYLLDPLNGTLQYLNSFDNLAKALPAPQATFPPQILQTAMTTSGDGAHIWGVADGGTGTQLIYLFDRDSGRMTGDVWTTSPVLLPRVTVPYDGSWAMIGWAVFQRSQCGPGFAVRSRHPGAVTPGNITGHAADSKNKLIYAMVPDGTQPAGPPFPAGKFPAMSIMDADNLAVRDKLNLPENIIGRAVLNSAGSMMYAISDSGLMVLPVGSLNKQRRLAVSSEDLLVQSNFCNRNATQQTIQISDPGGNRTDFSISTTQAGVTVSPNVGTTPATVTVTIDPSAIQNTFGTIAIPLQITSTTAVNVVPPVRLLISNPDQDQRGSIVNVPGVLTDIVPDTARNRFYLVRKDRNQVLLFNGANNQQIGMLRTGTTPRRLSLTADSKSLLVANSDSQYVQVFDLDSLQEQRPIELPAGHYARSVAQPNVGTFAVVENDAEKPGNVDSIDMRSGCGAKLPSLGVWENKMDPESVLTTSPSRSTMLLAEADGNVKLFDSVAGTWVLSRKDLSAPTGAYAAADAPGPASASVPDNPTDVGVYIVGNNILNPALVPIGALDTSVGNTVGFAFTGQDQAGFRVSGNTAAGPGVIQNMPALRVAPGALVKPVRVAEAPILSSTAVPFTRTVAPMQSAGTVVLMTTSGFTALSSNYDQATTPPSIASVVNAADGTAPVAPGGLISIYGKNLAPTNLATSQIPLGTALGRSCITVNGILAPLLFVSGSQINAQLPSRLGGNASMQIHTPGGVSDTFNFSVTSTAPSVFQTGSAGPSSSLATIVRADNNELVTPTNPIHTNDVIVVYLTGMGATAPAVDDGMPAPADPLASALVTPTVTLGGKSLPVYYAGLVPGYVGLYQINATVPFGVPQGLDIPLVITQNGTSTTLPVRVVK